MLFNRYLLAVSLLTCVLFSRAEGDIKISKKPAMCSGCHDQNGIVSNPQYLNLAGKNTAYLEPALHRYKSVERKGGQAALMYGMVTGLSADDIKNLAAYFNFLSSKTNRLTEGGSE
jgi:cytochrome c553